MLPEAQSSLTVPVVRHASENKCRYQLPCLFFQHVLAFRKHSVRCISTRPPGDHQRPSADQQRPPGQNPETSEDHQHRRSLRPGRQPTTRPAGDLQETPKTLPECFPPGTAHSESRSKCLARVLAGLMSIREHGGNVHPKDWQLKEQDANAFPQVLAQFENVRLMLPSLSLRDLRFSRAKSGPCRIIYNE